MGMYLYTPFVSKSTNLAQVAVDEVIKNTSLIDEISRQISEGVQLAVTNAIQENIVIPLKTFILDSWELSITLVFWGGVFFLVFGSVVYMLGDEVKGKKIMIYSLVAQIIMQFLNYVFLG